MENEERKKYKKKMNLLSPLSRKIANTLYKNDYLKTPDKENGWGLSEYIELRVASIIESIIQNKELLK